MTVRELLERIDSRELTEWAVFFSLEPWGTEVEDWRAGLIAATIANVNRDPKQRRQPYEPSDFMPRRAAQVEVEEQSVEEQAQIMEAWARILEATHGGGSK